jgi:glutamyl-tRNA synthetase
MVLGEDKTRLSKRHGAMSVTVYRDMGYLPDAFLNYLVRLGWSFGDQEFFTKEALIEKFNLENIGKSAGVFNPDKMFSINADHIKVTPPLKLAEYLLPFLKERGCDAENDAFTQSVIKTLNNRSKTLLEMADGSVFYYNDTFSYDEKAAKKFLKQTSLEPLTILVQELYAVATFDQENLEKAFITVMEKTGLKLGKIAQPVRVALTGKTVSPGIFEIIEVLGKDRSIARIENAIKFIEEKQE